MTRIKFGALALVGAFLGTALMWDFGHHGSRLFWVGYLFPVSLVIGMIALRLNVRGALKRPGFVIAALLQWPVTLAVLGGAFFGIASIVSSFSFLLVWICYAVALLTFVSFTWFLAKQVTKPSQRSTLILLIANVLCLVLVAVVYRALQSFPQLVSFPNLVFPLVFIPLSTLNGYWFGGVVSNSEEVSGPS